MFLSKMCLALLGCLVSIDFCSQSWCSWRFSWSIWRCIARWLSQCLATQGVHIISISYPLSSLVIPCPIMNSGSEVLMQTARQGLITQIGWLHMFMMCFCWYSVEIGYMIDSVWFAYFLRNCLGLVHPGSSRFIAWFRFCPPLVEPLLLMLWTCLTQGAPQPAETSAVAELDSAGQRIVGGVVWRGMACHVRLEGEPLMDSLSRHDKTHSANAFNCTYHSDLRLVWG